MRDVFLKRTLPEGATAKIFHEVHHTEELGLRNPNQLRIFCLDITNTKFSYASLKDFLVDCVGYYVFDRAEIKKLEEEGHIHSIGWRAMQRMLKNGKVDQQGTGNELSVILLYAFLEDVLGAPKLFSKIELSAFDQVHSDSVHLLPMPEDDSYFQMVFGTSNIVGDLGDAVDKAFAALTELKKTEEDEVQLVSTSFLKQCFENKETENYFVSILQPSEEQVTRPEPAFGIFLGYSIDLDKSKYTNREYPGVVAQKIEMDIRSLIDDIKQKIDELGMDSYSFYIYVLPLDEAEADKKAILQELLVGGE